MKLNRSTTTHLTTHPVASITTQTPLPISKTPTHLHQHSCTPRKSQKKISLKEKLQSTSRMCRSAQIRIRAFPPLPPLPAFIFVRFRRESPEWFLPFRFSKQPLKTNRRSRPSIQTRTSVASFGHCLSRERTRI